MARRFRAAFDGGARGNPGPAAWGVAVLDDQGACVERHAGYLGHATNNVAEYNGLLESLRLAARRGATDVALQADSELIVKQLRGEYKVKNAGLKPLFDEARRLIAGFGSFSIRHVRRADNKEADRLVNEALDRAAAGSPDAPPRIEEVCGP